MNLLRHFLLAAPRRGGGSKNISGQQIWWIWFWGSPSWKKLAHGILCYMWKKHNGKNYVIRLRTDRVRNTCAYMCCKPRMYIVMFQMLPKKSTEALPYICSQALHAPHYNLHLCLRQERNRIRNVTTSKKSPPDALAFNEGEKAMLHYSVEGTTPYNHTYISIDWCAKIL